MDLGLASTWCSCGPLAPANVAAACRALKNMGLRSAGLVGAAPGLDRARGAGPGLRRLGRARRRRTRRDSLREAVAASTLVAGTSGPAHAAGLVAAAAGSRGGARARRGAVLALVFGPEASGLSDEELALCHVARAHPHRPRPAVAEPRPGRPGRSPTSCGWPPGRCGARARGAAAGRRATAGELEAALAELRQGLLGIGYLNRENPDADPGRVRAPPRACRPDAARGDPPARPGPAGAAGRRGRDCADVGAGTDNAADVPRREDGLSELARADDRPRRRDRLRRDGGRLARGRIFLPAAASHHNGPMRADEWMNEPTPFFPFLPDGRRPSGHPQQGTRSWSLSVPCAGRARRAEGDEQPGPARGQVRVRRAAVSRASSSSTCPRATSACSTT